MYCRFFAGNSFVCEKHCSIQQILLVKMNTIDMSVHLFLVGSYCNSRQLLGLNIRIRKESGRRSSDFF